MKNNQLIVEAQETGKTTYLYSEVNRLFLEGTGIILLDSATEHQDKSLLRKIVNQCKNTVVFDMQDENQIVLRNLSIQEFTKDFMNYFPFNEVIKNQDKIICFDLSYFLEKGHEIYEKTNDIEKYNYYRNLYNYLAQQIVLSLILMENYGIIQNQVVVMDEIEFPITDYDISKYQKEIQFLASVHPENSFGTFYENFDKIKFKKYQKRKD